MITTCKDIYITTLLESKPDTWAIMAGSNYFDDDLASPGSTFVILPLMSDENIKSISLNGSEMTYDNSSQRYYSGTTSLNIVASSHEHSSFITAVCAALRNSVSYSTDTTAVSTTLTELSTKLTNSYNGKGTWTCFKLTYSNITSRGFNFQFNLRDDSRLMVGQLINQ